MQARRLAAFALAISLCCTIAFAQSPAAQIGAHVRVLAGDGFAGRGVAQAGEGLTLAYIVRAFRDAGLEGGGEDGGYLQPVRLAIFNRGSPAILKVRVGGQDITWASGREAAVNSRVAETDLTAAPLIFAGYGVTAPEVRWNDYAAVDMRGKIAVVLANDPDFDKPAGPFGGPAMSVHGRVSVKVEAARRAGAVGLLIIHRQPASRIPWMTYQGADTDPVWDLADADFGLRGWLSEAAAVDLFKRAGLDLDALQAAAGKPGFRAVPIQGAALSTRFTTRITPVVSYNVVARLPGKARPEQSVLASAHWDAYGLGAPDRTGDRIRNGAVDNAIGVGQLIELAKRLAAGPRLDRSVVFAAFTAEEKDLLGSAWYAAHPAYPLATTAAAVNLDPHQLFGRSRNVELIGKGMSDLDDVLTAAASARGLRVEGEAAPEAGWYFRSDHASLARVGVPALYFRMGRDLETGGLAAGEAALNAYTRERYHQPSDAFDAGWDLGAAVQELDLAEAVIRALGDSGAWPQWRAGGAAFKDARQISSGERSPPDPRKGSTSTRTRR